ncbi:MAG TPA: hypothetical protein VN841_16850 [Bryobacteraceae bacterium]|nr:hypothetical protein [Bryobacteraceae bacterium]
MPKIQWTDLPLALRDHFFERAAERKIAGEDLLRLKRWRQTEPDAPEGRWFKDFGSFKICGEGKFPKTFLLKGQAASGEEL